MKEYILIESGHLIGGPLIRPECDWYPMTTNNVGAFTPIKLKLDCLHWDYL